MKQTLTRLLLALLIVTGMTACKKEKSKEKPNNPQPPGIQSRLLEYHNGEEFIQFAYAADGKVKKVKVLSNLNTNGHEIDYTIHYRADGKIGALVAGNGGDRIETVYDNNQLQRADMFTNNVRTGYTTYAYEASGNLKRAIIYFGIGADFQPFLEFDFKSDANGNVMESVFLMDDGTPGTLKRAGHVTMKHDRKTNPLYQYRDLLALFWQPASRNNILKEEHYDENLQLEDIFQYSYTYKADGLPESGVVKAGLPGAPPTISNIRFVYQ